ncbi:MAG: hypothetical protein IJ093_02200 [Bacilli bacterium]|nr:hypothetical protein [Bacilli bacterium]
MASINTDVGKIDLSKISYTKADASSGNYIDENNILTEYWEDAPLEVEDMGDGTYRISQDGIYMGWTSSEGIITEVEPPAGEGMTTGINKGLDKVAQATKSWITDVFDKTVTEVSAIRQQLIEEGKLSEVEIPMGDSAGSIKADIITNNDGTKTIHYNDIAVDVDPNTKNTLKVTNTQTGENWTFGSQMFQIKSTGETVTTSADAIVYTNPNIDHVNSTELSNYSIVVDGDKQYYWLTEPDGSSTFGYWNSTQADPQVGIPNAAKGVAASAAANNLF